MQKNTHTVISEDTTKQKILEYKRFVETEI